MQLPQDFIELIKPMLPHDWEEFVAALSQSPEVSIRHNSKLAVDNLPSSEHAVPWCPNAYYLSVRPNFTLDPLFHAGAYYVQEASSMFVFQALKQYVSPSSLILDMCAAPGGKSTLVAQFLSEDGLLVSNEYVSQRAHILSENIQKWGCPNNVVTNNAPEHFEHYAQMFDTILVDAPCSGEGMFRKDEGAIKEWSLSNVEKCVARQREILHSAYLALAEDGYMIYSTCTYNTKENEENVQWLIDNYDMEYCPLQIEDTWNIIETERGYRFMPHKTKGEGLFLAVLRKAQSSGRYYKVRKNKQAPPKDPTLLKWLNSPNRYETIIHKDVIHAISKDYYALVCDMLSHLNVFSFGVPLATIKGKNHVPNHSLAISKDIKLSEFNTVELYRQTALTYLKTETLMLPGAPLGILLVMHQSLPLGWVKNIGNRCNNMYPSNWRIRMSIS